MKRVNEFVEHLNEVFRLFGTITSKPMFGGYGIYHQGLMIGLVANDTLYLKMDALTAPQFSEAGCVPFEYTKNGTTMRMSYASAPIEHFDDPEMAKDWGPLPMLRLYGAEKGPLTPPQSPPAEFGRAPGFQTAP